MKLDLIPIFDVLGIKYELLKLRLYFWNPRKNKYCKRVRGSGK